MRPTISISTNFKLIEPPRRWWLLIVAGYCLVCAVLAWRLYHFPSQVERADAWGYVNHALELRENGLLGKLSSWRTYGYIWFLYFCSLVFSTGRQALAWGAAGMQAILYAAAVFALAITVRRSSRRLAYAIAAGLLLNPILVALVIDTLTESLTLISGVLLLTVLLRACRAPTLASKLPWLVTGAAVASFSLMIRPANLPLLVAWNVAVLALLWGGSVRSTAQALLVFAVVSTATAVIVWLPQLIIAANHFGGASIFPASSLGDFQITTGLKLLKYATRIKEDLAAGIFYPNPWLTSLPDTGPLWHWYVQNPLAGTLTAASHVFNALNYDHPFVYVYDTSLPYSAALAFLVWLLYALGAIDITISLRHSLAINDKPDEFRPALLFLMTMSGVSLATIAISAVESRFSLLIMAMVCVFAVHYLLRFSSLPVLKRSLHLGVVVTVGICGTLISEWMKGLISLTPV